MKCKAVKGDDGIWMPHDSEIEEAIQMACPECVVPVGDKIEGVRAEGIIIDDPGGEMANAVESAVAAFENLSTMEVVEFIEKENSRIKLEYGRKGKEYIYHIWAKLNINNIQHALNSIFELSDADIEYVPEMKSWCVNVAITGDDESSYEEIIPELIMQI
jgi:hypothetical protein